MVALVAISSCANHVNYWAAFLIGCLAGKKLPIYFFIEFRMLQHQNVLYISVAQVSSELVSQQKTVPSRNDDFF